MINYMLEYAHINDDVITYIEKIKIKDKDTPLIDIILDFCTKNDLDLDLVGDAISTDVYFMEFLKKDCEFNKIFKSNIVKEEW